MRVRFQFPSTVPLDVQWLISLSKRLSLSLSVQEILLLWRMEYGPPLHGLRSTVRSSSQLASSIFIKKIVGFVGCPLFSLGVWILLPSRFDETSSTMHAYALTPSNARHCVVRAVLTRYGSTFIPAAPFELATRVQHYSRQQHIH